MRNHTVRLYVTAATVLAFFVLWTTVAAHPWSAPARPAADPRLLALAARDAHLRHEAAQVKQLVAHRWQVYERRLRERQRQIARAGQQHERQLAAARAAASQIAAQQAASYSAAAPSYSAPASAAPAQRVVTLPPQVKIVQLAPVTSTSSSHP
jgi:hypothetical protein